MKGEGVSYPAFLLGRSGGKPLAFNGPSALFISGRFRPPIGPMEEEILVDSSGRSWALHAVTAVGRWGTWKERLLLWWRRQYRVEFQATDGPGMSLGELKDLILEKAVAGEAAMQAEPDVDERVRQHYLEGWRRAREQFTAAGTFEGIAEAMGPYRLREDNWFSGQSRSNRAEYLAVFLSAVVITAMAQLAASWAPLALGLAVEVVFGMVVPMGLVAAATARRCHDCGWSFRAFFVSWMVICSAELMAQRWLHFTGDPQGWIAITLCVLTVPVLAIMPGTAGENRYDLQPNPGPSL